MKRTALITICFLLLIACQKEGSQPNPAGEGNLNLYIARNCLANENLDIALNYFAENINCKLRITRFNDGLQILDHIGSERDSSDYADVIIGVDNTLLADLSDLDILTEYRPAGSDDLIEELFYSKFPQFIPIAYSYLAFIYNSEATASPPLTFGIMQDGIWKNKIILYDPHNSSLGRAMLYWSVSAFGENGYGHFWRSVKENIFHICSDFDQGYTMFLAREAPLVLAFSTTPVYHKREVDPGAYKAVIPSEGSFRFILGAALCRESQNPYYAEKLMDYLVSEEFQVFVPFALWMYPAGNEIELPPEFDGLISSEKEISDNLSFRTIQRNRVRWMRRWKEIMLD